MQNNFDHEFLVSKEDQEFHSTYDTILRLGMKALNASDQKLLLQSEIENLLALLKENLEKEEPKIEALTFYYQLGSDQELAQLPPAEKLEKITYFYEHEFRQPILQLSNLYNTFINAVAYLERIFEMIDEPVLVDDAPDATELPPIKGDVTFDDVTFSYDGSINVLEHFNLDVKAGESIALVGPTGAGKTTVVNLISRFYNINSGRVLVDGHDISKVTLHSLRAQMGIMLQDSFIFSGTIMDNIRYGRLDATDEEIIAAAKTVRAHEFISEMPDGYYTQVNERGSRLSHCLLYTSPSPRD
mgnify:CR=1 FL=1